MQTHLAYDLLHLPGIRCLITGSVMRDPKLLVANGVSYERSAITAHLRDNGTNPETGELLDSSQRRLLPNPALKQLIDNIWMSVEQMLDGTSA